MNKKCWIKLIFKKKAGVRPLFLIVKLVVTDPLKPDFYLNRVLDQETHYIIQFVGKS